MSKTTPHLVGNSLLERLPNELLFRILDLLVTKKPPASSRPKSWFMLENLPTEPNAAQETHSLLPCLLVSHRMRNVAVSLFYRDVKLVKGELAAKSLRNSFLDAMGENPNLAPLIRSFDMTEYQGHSGPLILQRALSLFPRLWSLHIRLAELKSLKSEDIHKIFYGMSELETLAIENSLQKTEPSFLAEVLRVLEVADQTLISKIDSLTIRNESGLSYSSSNHSTPFFDRDIFSKCIPRFPKLQTLDLGYTSIDPKALLAIDSNTRLRYLRIGHCQENDTSILTRFLSTHSAIRYSLVAFDGMGLNFSEGETGAILANLPPSLRSLNLSSSMMTTNHVPDLQKLCRHLEEMSVGHGLTMNDVEAAIIGSNFRFDADDTYYDIVDEGRSNVKLGHELVLGPMRDAIAVCHLRRRLASVSPIPAGREMYRSCVRYLDLSSMDQVEQGKISNSVILGRYSMPLNCVVVSNILVEDFRALRKICGACEWQDKWVGRKVWIDRK